MCARPCDTHSSSRHAGAAHRPSKRPRLPAQEAAPSLSLARREAPRTRAREHLAQRSSAARPSCAPGAPLRLFCSVHAPPWQRVGAPPSQPALPHSFVREPAPMPMDHASAARRPSARAPVPTVPCGGNERGRGRSSDRLQMSTWRGVQGRRVQRSSHAEVFRYVPCNAHRRGEDREHGIHTGRFGQHRAVRDP